MICLMTDNGEKHPHGRGEGSLGNFILTLPLETPPRAWGRLAECWSSRQGRGNTPTGVGKARLTWVCRRWMWKHPHGRGEGSMLGDNIQRLMETPPRAWGRRLSPCAGRPETRNTPTGVGKAMSVPKSSIASRKHPHGRGEGRATACHSGAFWETPPRAWGRPCITPAQAAAWRNTPTGVGKAPLHPPALPLAWKHPHGRGEGDVMNDVATFAPETPPRAWGRRGGGLCGILGGGNTPTGVGKAYQHHQM